MPITESNPTKDLNVTETFTDLFVFFEESSNWLFSLFASFGGRKTGVSNLMI
jgi:hypothetical protein